MIYRFHEFELDSEKVELRSDGRSIALQPQVFDLLFLLVENHERLVSREEIVEKIWQGRAISETAISSRIKALRQSLGDDGTEQRIIRTIHGRGFRCISNVVIDAPALVPASFATLEPEIETAEFQSLQGQPSIAVLPFRVWNPIETESLGDALAHDIIVSLSRLRWLRVIARGSSFRFREPDPDIDVVGRTLGVRYCLSGTVERTERGAIVGVELCATSDASIVWSERFEIANEELSALRTEICACVVSALEYFIPVNEAQLAQRLPEARHDSWSRFHLGLHYMFRFNRLDNARAAEQFRGTLGLEPGFSRAWAGLSFTDFQTAYLAYDRDTTAAIRSARVHSERAIQIDDNDAFAHFTMGRVHWLEGRIADSKPWLEGATELLPNYAQAHYALAWADAMLGQGKTSRDSIDRAMLLSPVDPFLYAMRGTRALSYLAEGAPEKAIRWIESASGTPGAHPVVGLVAAASHALAGNDRAARTWVERMRAQDPSISQEYFFRSIPFSDLALRREIGAALTVSGLS
jgi:TolB-like protein